VIAPHCPVHVGTEMQLIELRMPFFVAVGESGSSKAARKKRRKSWRCALWPSCSRVAIHGPSEEEREKKMCPKCGKPSDAPLSRLAVCSYICRACMHDRDKVRYSKTVKEKRRAA
jgi:hypothetical protein